MQGSSSGYVILSSLKTWSVIRKPSGRCESLPSHPSTRPDRSGVSVSSTALQSSSPPVRLFTDPPLPGWPVGDAPGTGYKATDWSAETADQQGVAVYPPPSVTGAAAAPRQSGTFRSVPAGWRGDLARGGEQWAADHVFRPGRYMHLYNELLWMRYPAETGERRMNTDDKMTCKIYLSVNWICWRFLL